METRSDHQPPFSLDEALSTGLVEPIGYDRNALQPGVLHLGMGNFHRAHQASILHEALQQDQGDWTIQGVGMLQSDKPLIQAMRAQNNLYTLTELSPVGESRLRVIGSIGKTLLAPEESTEVVEAMASAETKIISLTITEGGYSNTSSGDLNLDDPKIQHDLDARNKPMTGLGYLFAGMQARRLSSGAPVTILSCDNLLGNGDLTRNLLLQFAEIKDPATAAWISGDDHVGFPNSMVDRITPGTNPETLSYVERNFSIKDSCPVVSEDFRQWVIEDKFRNTRPLLENIDGVLVVEDVEPYEVLKTQLLNGSHTALAYAAYLIGHRKVDKAITDPLINKFIAQYMNVDVTPSLPKISGIDVAQYKSTLLERFSNPAISDQVERLAKDGCAKVAIYLVPALRKQLISGGSIKHMAFALAAWGRYLNGYDEQGNEINIDDDIWTKNKRNIQSGADLLSIEDVFGPDLSRNSRLKVAVDDALDDINKNGTERALQNLLINNT